MLTFPSGVSTSLSQTKMLLFSVLFLGSFLLPILADTPANCTYDDIEGEWLFVETERSQSSNENCSVLGPVVYKRKIQLLFPNLAVDEFGNGGYWTVIYNQGFEVVIQERKYFAFSYYKQNGDNVTSYCDRIFNGWSHDTLIRNWACFNGQKTKAVAPKFYTAPRPLLQNKPYRINKHLITKINSRQNSWTAKPYRMFEGMPYEDMLRMRGGRKSRLIHKPSPAPVTSDIKKAVEALPLEFDWRNVKNVNFVSPVRNQGSCGSCYAFASMAMLEARIRILTNNTKQVVLSPQDVVSCSEYSQGCEGGFPYLIAGKYAQDFGALPENCDPYVGKDGPCQEKKCTRQYVVKYHYVGGFYGGCNEALMRLALLEHGPIAVGFEVYEDFQAYEGGIYHHTGLQDKYNPFELTNHAVLVVGYGADPKTGEKYWIVKNSWGDQWGEKGFFRIRRGNDECGIESLGVEAFPIP